MMSCMEKLVLPKNVSKTVLVKGKHFDEFHEIRITYLPKEELV